MNVQGLNAVSMVISRVTHDQWQHNAECECYFSISGVDNYDDKNDSSYAIASFSIPGYK